ncbi:MAG TPA: aminoglycoside phosphotransferase [Gammaproteobacteria bacterium]|nr:aminoglycoside phosphotransferase [Gammaproteobacteria bacterium]
MDPRRALIEHWLRDDLGLAVARLEPASADASFRRYFRVRHGRHSHIVMDAPPAREDSRSFIAVARAFAALGLRVPTVHAADLERGLLLLDDLGSEVYLQVLHEDNADALYGDAQSALIRLLGADPGALALPPFDRSLLLGEMALFRDWLLGRHLRLSLAPEQEQELKGCFDFLAGQALLQPQVWVHRDYHSRNLMRLPRRNPGILDFQDAVVGPVTYDLVSLLRDCYIRWPRQRVKDWVAVYLRRAQGEGYLREVAAPQFQRWFDLMGVQRHLKAAGIFARLYHRDGKPGYLADIPRTVGYIVEVADDHPPLRPLGKLLRRQVLPALPAQLR